MGDPLGLTFGLANTLQMRKPVPQPLSTPISLPVKWNNDTGLTFEIC